MPRRKSVPTGMPLAETERGSAREELAIWMKLQFEKIDAEHQARIEVLRTIGEHPSPIFSNLVKKFAGLGMEKKHIARLLGITQGMLVDHYTDDMELGAAQVLSMVAANMTRMALSESDPNAAKVGMAILDRRGGEQWKPPAKQLEVDDKRNEAPIIDSSKLTFEERQQMRAMLMRIADGGAGEPITDDEIGVIE